MASDHPPKIAVLLVHGTWGRGIFFHRKNQKNPRWFESGSQFYNRLSDELRRREFDARLESFYWSGHNSLAARNSASVDLAKRLEELVKEEKDRTLIVIAHSHGGNVAAHSMNYLNAQHVSPMIIALATPFVEVAQARTSLISRITTTIGVLVVVQAGGIILYDTIVNQYGHLFRGFLNEILYYAGIAIISLCILCCQNSSLT